ncbi:MAG: hypothetical protein R3219_04995 [Hydrogenovibrio sp.]|nr:hypothetical protein [Hydrogenovibrio sp.]
MSLESALNAWNGKTLDDLESIYRQFYREPDFAGQVIALLTQKQQRGASWLLKTHLENHFDLSSELVMTVFKSLSLAKQWQTQLNLLQCLPFLHPYPEQKKAALVAFLKHTLSSRHKWVRVWGYHGVYELAKDFPEVMDESFAGLKENRRSTSEDASSQSFQLDFGDSN